MTKPLVSSFGFERQIVSGTVVRLKKQSQAGNGGGEKSDVLQDPVACCNSERLILRSIFSTFGTVAPIDFPFQLQNDHGQNGHAIFPWVYEERFIPTYLSIFINHHIHTDIISNFPYPSTVPLPKQTTTTNIMQLSCLIASLLTSGGVIASTIEAIKHNASGTVAHVSQIDSDLLYSIYEPHPQYSVVNMSLVLV